MKRLISISFLITFLGIEVVLISMIATKDEEMLTPVSAETQTVEPAHSVRFESATEVAQLESDEADIPQL